MQSKRLLDSFSVGTFFQMPEKKSVNLFSAAVTAAALLTSKQTLWEDHLQVTVVNFGKIQHVFCSPPAVVQICSA